MVKTRVEFENVHDKGHEAFKDEFKRKTERGKRRI